MRNTTLKSEVIAIIGGKPHKGTVVEVFSEGAARIELGDHSTLQASYSNTGEEGTFHYPDEAKAVKASETFGEPPAPPAESAPVDGAEPKKNSRK